MRGTAVFAAAQHSGKLSCGAGIVRETKAAEEVSRAVGVNIGVAEVGGGQNYQFSRW